MNDWNQAAEFKFQLGDLVTHRGDPGKIGQSFVVIGRILDQCSGGIQRHYKIHTLARHDGWSSSGNMSLWGVMAHESELEKAEEKA